MAPSRPVVTIVECSFMPRANGSHIRMWEMIEFLSARFANLTVYSFREHVEFPWTERDIALFTGTFPKVRLVLDHHRPLDRLATRVRNAMTALFPSWSAKIICLSVPGTPEWRRLRAEQPNAAYLVNFVDVATVVNGLPRKGVFYETHDIKSLKAAKIAGVHPSHTRIVLKFRSETSILSTAEALIAISAAEVSLLMAIAPGPKVLYVPSYAALPDAAPATGGDADHDLLFVGAHNNFNVDGICRFIETHRSWLGTRRLAIAGNVCTDPQLVELVRGMENVKLLGFVDDLATLYQSVRIVLCPVDGTGLKIKLVEALAFGKPVFASKHAQDGLPAGWQGAVFDLDPATMDMLLEDNRAMKAANDAVQAYYRIFVLAGDREGLAALIAAR